MAWDFSTEPEFQEKLDWMRDFVREEVWPIETTAVQDGDDWVINGRKWFSSNGSVADFLIVMAVTDPEAHKYQRASMLIVPVDTPGVQILRDIPTMEHPYEHFGRYGGHSENVYENGRVPGGALLGE